MNQFKAVKEYLEAGNTLTSMEAFKMFGCTRLSDKIFRLRKQGYIIDSIPCEGTTRFGDTTHFVKYRLSSVNELLKEKQND